MAIKTLTEKQRRMTPAQRMLQIKIDQELELQSLALRDGDVKDAEKHKQRANVLMQQFRDMMP